MKNTIVFLLREQQELKKDIQLKKRLIDNKDREIERLKNKIQKIQLTLKRDMMDDGTNGDLDEENTMQGSGALQNCSNG